jgi:nitrate/TMAO reductase-like tetraheme cytochrome c subunit
LNFCTDCHFRRDPAQYTMHSLGYRDRHGIEARMSPSSCAGCHQAGYCSECHAGRSR